MANFCVSTVPGQELAQSHLFRIRSLAHTMAPLATLASDPNVTVLVNIVLLCYCGCGGAVLLRKSPLLARNGHELTLHCIDQLKIPELLVEDN